MTTPDQNPSQHEIFCNKLNNFFALSLSVAVFLDVDLYPVNFMNKTKTKDRRRLPDYWNDSD